MDLLSQTRIGWTSRRRPLPATTRLQKRWAVAVLPVLDTLCIALSFALAYHARFQWLPYHAEFSASFYWRLVLGLIPIWLIIFSIYRLYDANILFGGVKEYAHVVNACTVSLMAIILYSFLTRGDEQDISRGWLVMAWVFSIAIVGSARFLYRRFVYHMQRKGFFLDRALIVGANEEGMAIARQMQASRTAGVRLLGFVDDDLSPGSEIDGLPVLGRRDSLESLIRRLQVDELVVVPTAVGREALLDIYRTWGAKNGVRVRLSPGLYELFTTGIQVQKVGFVPLVSLDKLRITGMDAFLKTALDYSVAISALIFLSPLLLAIAAWVKLGSPGTILHRRRVLGVGGRAFDAFKFRTMITNADEYLKQHPELAEELEREGKLKNDPRVTRLGRFLRQTSLDELPQFFNIVLGQMSLVGPRMITQPELEKFGKWRHNLLTVRPGLSGLWQVSGRSDLSYEDRVRLDMYYIRNYTIWLDLKILFQTIAVVLKGVGAY